MAISSIDKTVIKGYNKAISGKWLSKRLEDAVKNPASFATKMMMFSFVTKDAINCAIYTTQSWTNDKIPPDKRPFVASLDFFNGIFNVLGQAGAYVLFDKFLTPRMFGAKYSGSFQQKGKPSISMDDKFGKGSSRKSRLLPDNIDGVLTDILNSDETKIQNPKIVKRIKGILKDSNINLKNITPEQAKLVKDKLVKTLSKGARFSSFEKGFALIVTALATTALVKRTLTPLFATPLAGMAGDAIQKRMQKNEPEDRLDYEREAVEAGQFNKIDTTAFNKVSSRNKW